MFAVYYDQDADCVIGEYEGDFDQQALIEFASEIRSVAEKFNCKKFLTDLRGANIDYSKLVLNDVSQLLDSVGFGRKSKRAIVVSRDLKHYNFFETVAKNRGYTVRVFNDRGEAVDWLKKKYKHSFNCKLYKRNRYAKRH